MNQLGINHTRSVGHQPCSNFVMNQLGINHTGSDRAIASSRLCKWAIVKIYRDFFKESSIDNTSSRFTAFFDLSPQLVIILL